MLLLRIRKLIQRHFKEVRWHGVLISLLGYVLVSWLLLYGAGETALLGTDIFYWMVITASTVGLMLLTFFYRFEKASSSRAPGLSTMIKRIFSSTLL